MTTSIDQAPNTPESNDDIYVSPYDTLASPEARASLEEYVVWCEDQKRFGLGKERKNFVDHAKRVTRILYTYCDDFISDAVYDVALLHDVIDRVDDAPTEEQRRKAAHTIVDYYTSKSHSEDFWRYQSSLMGELTLIEHAAEEYRRKLGRDEGVDPRLREALTNSHQGAIDADVWAMEGPVIDIGHLHAISKSVNIESFMVKAAEAIDNLMDPAHRPAALLQDCIEAETFHAPMCEVLGLDAMAAKLRSEAAKRRLEGQGRHDLIDKAAEINQYADYFAAQNMFSELFGTDDVVILDTHGRMLFNEESMHFGSGRIGGCLEGNRMTYRIKTVGSLALKLQRDGEDSFPLDIFGMTVVVEDAQRLGEVFTNTIKTLQDNSQVRFECAPSKTAPVFVQGTEKYVDDAHASLEAAGITWYQLERSKDESQVFHVCKFTAVITNERGQELPIEVQFLTPEDRRNARIGATAHIVYKQQKRANRDIDVRDMVVFLEEIYDRKTHIDKTMANVNKRSIDRGVTFLDKINATL